jgi:hypothetical protein
MKIEMKGETLAVDYQGKPTTNKDNLILLSLIKHMGTDQLKKEVEKLNEKQGQN